MNNPEDQTSMIIMNNYFGIGIDADVCLQFHIKVWNESFHNYKDFLILLLYINTIAYRGMQTRKNSNRGCSIKLSTLKLDWETFLSETARTCGNALSSKLMAGKLSYHRYFDNFRSFFGISEFLVWGHHYSEYTELGKRGKSLGNCKRGSWIPKTNALWWPAWGFSFPSPADFGCI